MQGITLLVVAVISCNSCWSAVDARIPLDGRCPSCLVRREACLCGFVPSTDRVVPGCPRCPGLCKDCDLPPVNTPSNPCLTTQCPTGTECKVEYPTTCSAALVKGRCLPVARCSRPAFMNFTLTADNEITEFYYDGVRPFLPKSTWIVYTARYWKTTDTVVMPSTVSVLAVKVLNYAGSPAGFLASNTAGTILTNNRWRCTNVTPPSNWMTKAYDARSWQPAVEVDQNNGGPLYGNIPSISSAAKWIWFTNGRGWTNAWGTVAYCRLDL